MSRIGRLPITIPDNVKINIEENQILVEGPKGSLKFGYSKDIVVEQDKDKLIIKRLFESKEHKSLHGLTRALIANMVNGVTKGYSKELDVNGVGYRAAKQGNNLVMNLGYSHQVIMPEIDGIKIEVPNPNKIIIKGIDKQKVGQFAAEVRAKRPPEPYKGKGVKYSDEKVKHKEGKAGKGKK